MPSLKAHRSVLVGLLLVACAPAPLPGPAAQSTLPPAEASPPDPEIHCTPALPAELEAATERRRFCVVDAGSRNVKLVVSSVAGNDWLSLREERSCRSRLQLGDKTFDHQSNQERPLPDADQAALLAVVRAYQRRCDSDGGQMIGAIATEWARRATNQQAVVERLEARTGLRLEVVEGTSEARFGYLAATRGARGKLVLDFGSRSLQISFWPRDHLAPTVVSVPIGIDEAGDRFFAGPRAKNYVRAKRAFHKALRRELGDTFPRMRAALAASTLDRELYSLGENGDLLLALSGKLSSGKPRRAISGADYGSAISGLSPRLDARYGLVRGVVAPSEFRALSRQLQRLKPLFDDLRSDSLKRVYGNKMVVFPALMELLATELRLERIVLVPQGPADGLVLDKLAHLK